MNKTFTVLGIDATNFERNKLQLNWGESSNKS